MQIIQITAILVFLLFCLLILVSSFRLKQEGINLSVPKPLIQRIATTIFLLGFFLFYLSEMMFQSHILAVSILPELIGKNLHNTVWIAIPGLFFVLLGVITMCLTLLSFKDSLRFGLDASNKGELIMNGIFAYSRNPFFVSIELIFAGQALVFSTPFFISIAILSVISIHFFILKEEKFMLENYGDDYRKYRKKTRRYF